MTLVEFLEARICEQEAGILGVPSPLAAALRTECAQQRGILADWKLVAEADGIRDPAQAEGPIALARRSLLAAGLRDHEDYQEEWALRR